MPEGQPRAGLADLNERSREILRHIVDAYMESGEPVGSRTISRRLAMSLSPATIRNVMADLEDAGLLYAPHTSAGRLPTERGLSLFVSGLLELGGLSKEEREKIDGKCAAAGRSLAGRAGGRHHHALGPVALRRPGGGAEDGAPAEAYRVRPSRARPRPRGHGDRGRAGREPHHRRAHGPAARLADRGDQLS